MEINWVQLGIEAIGLVLALVVLYWKQRVEAEHRLTKLETHVSTLRDDHSGLSTKVDGISRNLASITGELKRGENK